MSDKSSKPKYNFNQTQEWAKQEEPEFDDGITFIYVFGALAFLILFTVGILYFAGDISTPTSTVKVEDIGTETDATTTEVEYNLLDDAKKEKNCIKAK